MSTHLDIETLERALHDELETDPRASVERHLATCADCADRLAEARRDEQRLLGLLETIDHDRRRSTGARSRASPSRRNARSLIAASLAFLVIAAGIMYAIPGSPLKSFVESVSVTHPSRSRP